MEEPLDGDARDDDDIADVRIRTRAKIKLMALPELYQ